MGARSVPWGLLEKERLYDSGLFSDYAAAVAVTRV